MNPALAQPARRVRRLRNPNLQVRPRALRHLRRHQLWNANAAIRFQMFLGAARAISLAVFVIPLARQLVAAADAIAISGDRSRLDGYQGHEKLSRGRYEGIIPTRRAARKTAEGNCTMRRTRAQKNNQ